MSTFVTMEFEHDGPATAEAGGPEGEDLLFAPNMPRRFDELAAAATALGVTHVFDFAPDAEALWNAAEQAVSGRAGEGHSDDELEELVDRAYFSSGPWFDPDEGLRSAEALAAYFRANPAAHAHPGLVADVEALAVALVADLESMAAALRVAKSRGRRFRLNYSY